MLRKSREHRDDEHFITGITDKTVIGFRSFALKGKQKLSLQTRGDGKGEFLVSTELDGKPLGQITVGPSWGWWADSAEIDFPSGNGDLYLTYHGNGSKELLTISF